jgi:hypothetical protein
MILDFTEKEKSTLILYLLTENNVLLKNILANQSCAATDINDIGNALNIDQESEVLQNARLDTIAGYNKINESYLEKCRPQVEDNLKSFVKILRENGLSD